MIGLGTLINTGTVLVGGVVGLVIGDRIPDRIRTIVVQVIGLVTLGIGLGDVLKTHNIVFPLVGMVIGGVIGELLAIEQRLEKFAELIRRRFARNQEPGKFSGRDKMIMGGSRYRDDGNCQVEDEAKLLIHG